MATTTARRMRIEQFLESLQSSVEDFPALVQEWDSLVEADQVGTSLQWDHLMADYLTELAAHYHGGEMTEGQAKRYCRLLGQLNGILPLVRKLKFSLPTVALEA